MSDDEKEIWVHISASTTRQNDDLYRSVADAYLHFEPCGASHDGPPASSLEESRISPTVTTSKDSYGSFPSHMDSGDLSSSQVQADIQVASSINEESQLSISRLDRLERIQAKWRQSTSRPSSAKAPPSSAFSDHAVIDNTQLAYQVLESQILDEASATSEDTSDEGSAAVRVPLAEAAGNPQNIQINTKSTTPPSSKTRRENSAISSFARSEPWLEASVPHLQAPERATLLAMFGSLPLEVYPPAPPITVLCPASLPTQMTRYLGILKSENPERFRPWNRCRALDQDERGCWVVETSAWPHTIRSQFWTLLAEHVGRGRLGWGITLHREPARSYELGLVRLYCWGEVVEHIWLALWLCSDGKVSVSGSKWVDAEENVVIRMTKES